MLVDCVTLQLPKVHDPRGNLTFVEGGRQIPFDIRNYSDFMLEVHTRHRAQHHHAPPAAHVGTITGTPLSTPAPLPPRREPAEAIADMETAVLTPETSRSGRSGSFDDELVLNIT